MGVYPAVQWDNNAHTGTLAVCEEQMKYPEVLNISFSPSKLFSPFSPSLCVKSHNVILIAHVFLTYVCAEVRCLVRCLLFVRKQFKLFCGGDQVLRAQFPKTNLLILKNLSHLLKISSFLSFISFVDLLAISDLLYVLSTVLDREDMDRSQILSSSSKVSG